jgi:hypothetical protein
MKKTIKIAFHLFSIVILSVIVFLAGIVTKITRSNPLDSKENDGSRKIAELPFFLEVQHAYADFPASSNPLPPGGDCEGGGGGGGGGGDC